ncbi:AAA family ATPase [Ihubacter massiliensis]|uniref:AAA family ATPase n=1 Tax=Hominibacterium faecale TaxID=2839743 RepID=A0A9J6QVF2_9FIRM|nr:MULTISPECIES: AAA family ATPase [Eubacteriales Family XIII. Incertae Sedis]MCO7121130.1 AAA family ATPase [Ihubacter massiliensis]MCU7378046.1 AAA family ATPase [Hominibacterium faecale]
MVNEGKLKNAIKQYELIFKGRWSDEKFKWEAIKNFKAKWDINAENFGQMFYAATENTYGLLASMNNFPRKMIYEYSLQDQETVRGMFINLYDESKDVIDRIIKFQADADEICNRLSPGMQHYQRPMAITVYLWLNYPDKYSVFKYTVCRETCVFLDSDFVPKKGDTSTNIKGNHQLVNIIAKAVTSEKSLVELFNEVMEDSCYPDPAYKTLAFDICFYISEKLSKKKTVEEDWIDSEYDPRISKDKWIELLCDEKIFTTQSLEIVYRLRDYGGAATCKQLSVKYGEEPNYYNVGSSSLGRRVAEKTSCEVRIDEEGKQRWWAVLYMGHKADKTEYGSFVWKLRKELKEALDEYDFDAVKLYSTEADDEQRYWWLNANPKIWSFSELPVGNIQSYTLFNENGNKRRIFQNFLDAKAGDAVIGYESYPVKQVVAVSKISQENDGKNLYFEKVEGLTSPIDYITLRKAAELEKMEYFVNPQGSLFKLTKGEYDFIMDVIREENPINEKQFDSYTKNDFLADVYMTAEKYDTLIALLKKKQNIILQGAPGVGKTFAAKRLAYSIIGAKDENQIETIQFHQNYSYEDFIMGYKPSGDGFELRNGVFYKFCQRAANNPDLPYFFIIDEINRGNLSKIFGELLMLIEKEYRGTKTVLAYNGLTFTVPKNVYIIGMMNTADRSLAMIDYALRRRFSFYSMEPGFISEGFQRYMKKLDNETFNLLIEKVMDLNTEIIKDSSLGSGFCIGHSYFCNQTECTDEWMQSVVEYDIIPTLEEYWFDDATKLQRWQNILRGVFND